MTCQLFTNTSVLCFTLFHFFNVASFVFFGKKVFGNREKTATLICWNLWTLSFQRLAELVTQEDLNCGRVYPPLSDIRSVSLEIAVHVVEDAYRTGTATYFPEPEDKRAFVKEHVYEVDYDEVVPEPYSFP